MSTSEKRQPGREIARALEQTLGAAIAPGASWEAIGAARNAAQLLMLPGLDQLLSLLELGVDTDESLERALGQVRGRAAECVREGNLLPLQGADAEFGGMAVHLLGRTPGISSSVMSDPETALWLGEVLEDMPVRAEDLVPLARTVRLAAPVAAALRAAVDWLTGEDSPVPPRLAVEDGTLDVSFEQVNAMGLASTHHVLSSIGGNIGPAAGSADQGLRGKWSLRVPTLVPRKSYLMLVQGPMRLALPWHVVLRIHMIRESEVRSGLRSPQPILEPIAPLVMPSPECPVVLIGHGAKRGLIVADRLVWRMTADPVESNEPPPHPMLAHPVRTDDGEIFWAVDPARLMAAVEDPALIEMERTALREGTMLPTLGPDDVKPLALEFAEGEPPAESGKPAPAASRPPRATIIPVTASRSARPAGRPQAPPEAGAPLRALIAEDSITARVFLTRLLEQLGWTVKGVASAHELMAELYDASWSVVFFDVDLPDGRGHEFMRALKSRQTEAGASAPMIPLVRDDVDAEGAAAAGFQETLRKPFEKDEIERVLERLGLDRGGAR